jgi:hypothetical protein
MSFKLIDYRHVQAWREIDVRITRYHVEACDNAKFLGAIEKSSHAIYLEVSNICKMLIPVLTPIVTVMLVIRIDFENSFPMK